MLMGFNNNDEQYTVYTGILSFYEFLAWWWPAKAETSRQIKYKIVVFYVLLTVHFSLSLSLSLSLYIYIYIYLATGMQSPIMTLNRWVLYKWLRGDIVVVLVFICN
jgi:hypothetical protein